MSVTYTATRAHICTRCGTLIAKGSLYKYTETPAARSNYFHEECFFRWSYKTIAKAKEGTL